MIYFVTELIILGLLAYKMLELLFDDSIDNLKNNFYEYILCAIPFSLLSVITFITGYTIFGGK